MTLKASIRPYLNQAYLMGLLMMAVGLTLSPFLMGLSQFWLAGVWIIDGVCTKSFRSKLSSFVHNKIAILLVSFYLLHVVGLLYTSDFQYALRDLRVKLPILVLPFILSSMPPLDRKRVNLVMLVYVLSVFVATQFSFFTYIRKDYEDVREISHFISHIRFCLNIVFSMAIIGYYLYRDRIPKTKGVPAFGVKVALDSFLKWFLLFWFAYQIYIFESLSGYIILVAVVFVSGFYAAWRWKKSRSWHVAMVVVTVAILALGVGLVSHFLKPLLKVETVDFATLDKKTASGNYYWHDTVYNPIEDGRYVGLYYCKKELYETWSQRSDLPLDGKALNGQRLEPTLARYLTSKGLRKDAEGVMALSEEDIRNVEKGEANYNNWLHPGLRARLSSTLFEYSKYRRYNNPNGGSVSQRIEFTRASLHIVKHHWLFGVGTGDVPQAFAQAYEEINSPLNKDSRFRAHNQYLAIAVAFGLVGLSLLLLVLFYPWLSSRKYRTYLITVFICIMALSMFPEDTFETQAGASLFAFFYAFLFFVYPSSREGSIEMEETKKK